MAKARKRGEGGREERVEEEREFLVLLLIGVHLEERAGKHYRDVSSWWVFC